MAKPANLADLFKVGEIVTINVTVGGEPYAFDIWMRKPTVEQQQVARTKGSAASARTKRNFRDKTSDAYIALWDSIEDLEARENVVASLVESDRSTLSSTAYYEVLHGEYGSNWSDVEEEDGPEARDYAGIIAAEHTRFQEITTHNEADPESLVLIEEDEELSALRAEHALFDLEWDEYTEKLMKEAAAEYESFSDDDLRTKLAKESIGLEALMAFHQEYRIYMLHAACRKPDDRKSLYFPAKDDILELPLAIQTKLLGALDSLQSSDPKASATLQSS